MIAAFRADASLAGGTGHVVRCLALSDALCGKGARTAFVCRPLPGAVRKLIRERGPDVIEMRECAAGGPEDAVQSCAALHDIARRYAARIDWLVVDHYAIDRAWESRLRAAVGRIMVIDDLADRPHDCDVLLDQNLYDRPEMRYRGLVPPHCMQALGPTQALLRPEFFAARTGMRTRDGTLRRLLVAFGGSDPTNETAKTLRALAQPKFADLLIEVLIGAANPHGGTLHAEFGGDSRVRFHENASDVAALMASADAAVGAGGTMNWERCFLGLPSIVVVTATNQLDSNASLARVGAVVNLGWHADVGQADIAAAVTKLRADASTMAGLSARALALMDAGNVSRDEIRIVATLMRGEA